MNKVVASAHEAVADIADGASLAVGGFGLCGVPSVLIAALLERGTSNLVAVSNNCGTDDWGLGLLLRADRIRRMVSSYVGENREFERKFLDGELEVELVPQGTLAERLRAGGAGIPAFYTPTGVGTLVADGGLPMRFGPSRTTIMESPPKEVREIDFAGRRRKYVLEQSIVTDFALIRAWKADRHGNLVFRESARNFSPLCAMAATVTIVEAEHVVELGEIDADAVHLPGIYVHRVVPLTPDQATDKRVERVTTRRERRNDAT